MNKKTFPIIVNAQSHQWDKEKISFEEVVRLAFPATPENEIVFYTVTYDNGPRQNPKGSISKGDKIHTQEDMIFACTRTEQS